jgi:hypothetical protein
MKKKIKLNTKNVTIALIEEESPEQKKCFWFYGFIIATGRSSLQNHKTTLFCEDL